MGRGEGVVARNQPLHVTVKLVRGLPSLRCPEVREVLRYVFGNARKHFEQGKGPRVEDPIDLFSSAPWFDGFVESVTVRGL